MRKIYVLVGYILFLLPSLGTGQTTLLTETFGTTVGTYPIGWSSSNTTNGFAAVTTSASSGYTGASGSINARFTNTGTNGTVHTLTYSNNLSTVGYTNITVLWGGRATVTFTQPVTFQWSLDGTTWNNITYTQVANNSTWAFVNGATRITLPVGAAGISSLRFKWSITANNSGNYQIDDFTVQGTLVSSNTITTSSITGSPFCVTASVGSSVLVPFNSTGTFTSNTYTAQLSNASGSFASPISIGTLLSDGNSGTIATTIPAGSTAGTGYRIRVISSSPAATGTDNGSNLIVNAQPTIGTQPSSQIVTSPSSATFSVTASNAAGYQWQRYNGSAWIDLTNVAPYSGVATNTLTVGPTNTSYSDYEFRCVVKAAPSCTDVISSSAILTVNQGPCISEGFSGGTTAPFGWTFTSIGGTYTTATNYGAASPSLQIDATNDRILTSFIGTSASELSFWIKGQGTDAGSALLVEGWNGSVWITIDNINSLPTTGTTKIYNSASTPSLPTNLTQFRFTYTKSVGNLAFDDVNVNCATVTPCTPSATITSFSPAIGPVGTLVNITGTGFIGTSSVKFGTINATSFTVSSSTLIIAEVPANAPTDKIKVTVSSCDAVSSSNYSLIAANGCGTNGSGSVVNDISISEVYDSKNGSLSYIEVFNGTLSIVDLGANNYVVRVRTGVSTDNDYPLSGTLASGSVVLIRLGSSSTICTGLSLLVDQPSSSGFNGNDQIFLRKNGVDIDYVPNPGYPSATSSPGFSQARKATTTATTIPSITYTASDWITSTTESCSNLGVPPYTVGGSSVEVTVQPVDVNCAAVTFSVTSTGQGAGTNAVLWKYNDPNNMAGWSNAGNLDGTMGLITAGTNTATMTISGSVAQILNFQFYAEVQRGACVTTSNGAQYTYDTRKYYRTTTATGNWSDKTKWEMSNDNATWVAACNFPTSVNCDEITVRAGHTITLDIDNAVDKLTIDNTGKLISSANSELTLLNGQTGADFIINGTFEDGANSANSISFGTGASWQIASGATLIRTNTSGAAEYRDSYELGISNIPATANWIIRATSAINVPFTTATGTTGSYPSATYYPNLTIESTSGIWNPGPAVSSSRFTGNLSTAAVKGNLDIGGTGAGTVIVYNENTYTQPLLVNGNVTVRAGNTITNAGAANGTGFELKGHLTVDGTLNVKSNNIGLLKFSGTTEQTISGITAGVINLQDVTNANTGGAIVNVDKNIAIHGVLTLADASNLKLLFGYVNLKSTVNATARIASVNTGTIAYSGIGRFVVERYFPTHRAWRLMTAPVVTGAATTDNSFYNSYQAGADNTSANAGNGTYISGLNPDPSPTGNGLDVTPLNNYSLKTYNAVTNIFEPVTNTRTKKISGNTFNAGVPDNIGFFMFVRGDRFNNPNWVTPGVPVNSTTLRDTGKLQLQTYNFPATATVGGYTLIGNPYASPVDFTKVLTNGSTTGIANRFWSWDPNLSSVGAYVYFDAGTTPTPYTAVKVPVGAVGTIGQTTIIQSKQAVFVESSSASAPKVVFREADKDVTNNQSAYWPTNLPSAPMLAANIFFPDNVGNKILLDGNMVQAAKEFKNEVDFQEDAIKFTNINENFGIKNNKDVMILERRKPFTETDTINYLLTRTNRKAYQLQLMADQISGNNLAGYLEDNFQKTSTPINMSGDTWFDFSVSADAASADPNRFRVVFKKAIHCGSIKADLVKNDIAVEWSLINETDISNHEVERSADGINFIKVGAVNSKGNGSATTIYNWLDVQPATGIYYYRIKSIGLYGAIAYSETVKVKMVKSTPGMYVFPNPVTDDNINLQLNLTVQGVYRVRLINAAGQELLKQNIAHPGSNATHKITPAQMLTKGTYVLEVMGTDKQKNILKVVIQ